MIQEKRALGLLLMKCIARPIEDRPIYIYKFVSRMGDVPVCTGGAHRPQRPPSDAYARAMLLSHKPCRQASDLGRDSGDIWAPAFHRFLEPDTFPMALKVSVWGREISDAPGSAFGRTIRRLRSPTQRIMTRRSRGYTPPPAAAKTRQKWALSWPISDNTETPATGQLSHQAFPRPVSPGPTPPPFGLQRER